MPTRRAIPLLLLACVLVLPAAVRAAAADKIAPKLRDALNRQSSDDTARVPVILMLAEQADLAGLDADIVRAGLDRAQRAPVVIDALRSLASRSQVDLADALENWRATGAVERYRPFWLVNAFAISASPGVIEALAARADVGRLYLDGRLELDEPVDQGPAPQRIPGQAEDGLKAVRANALWDLGYTGAGVLVMNIDTGVDATHPAIADRWYGLEGGPVSEAWFDPAGAGCATPCDYDDPGHGTHTMGVMVGLEAATADTIGVAFGAQWIAAATIDVAWPEAHTSYSLAAFEWAVDPSPGSSQRPPADVINCSWWDPDLPEGDDCGPNGTYWAAIDAFEATGGAVVFSAGNGGPYASSITPPKNRAATPVNILATGNINPHDPSFPIMYSSSRGPSDCDEAVIKPEIVAPGGGIRSCIPGNYWSMTGTSQASPHVCGVIALLMEAFPWATGTQIKLALIATARDLGASGEDNTYGHGLIDAEAAYYFLHDATSVVEQVYAPGGASLGPGVPNPFNPSTTLSYTLAAPAEVSLAVYDARGQVVDVLVDGAARGAGPHSATWRGRTRAGARAASGMYFFRLEARPIGMPGAAPELRVRKAVLIK